MGSLLVALLCYQRGLMFDVVVFVSIVLADFC
jgi:hypothetical protein